MDVFTMRDAIRFTNPIVFHCAVPPSSSPLPARPARSRVEDRPDEVGEARLVLRGQRARRAQVNHGCLAGRVMTCSRRGAAVCAAAAGGCVKVKLSYRSF